MTTVKTAKGKRSAFKDRGLRAEARQATCRNAKDRVLTASTYHGRQTVNKRITSHVGLDVHKDSTVIGVADVGGGEPRFLGTVDPDIRHLLKALKNLGKPESWCHVAAG